MKIDSPFYLYKCAPESLKNLLRENYLGSNGAKYLHLDIETKLDNLECPNHICLERNGKVLANVTLDKRRVGWYVRYFAFSSAFHADRHKESGNERKNSFLKSELNRFFNELLLENTNETPPLIYAYIDPENVKSKWFARELGFDKVADISTQTFSRISPKKKLQLHVGTNREHEEGCELNKNLKYNYNAQTIGRYYTVNKSLMNELSCTVYHANWKIDSLPGKFGSQKVKLLPFIPFLSRIIKPRDHKFIVVENLKFSSSKIELVADFFETLLAMNNCGQIIWWVDKNDFYYKQLQNLNWGLLHKVVGVANVELCVKSKDINQLNFNSNSFYVSGYDLM